MKKNTNYLDTFEEIKKIALIALFSDDDLMDMLVLKGGNALNFIYKIASRSSVDLDFSIEKKIKESDFDLISAKISKTLELTFSENNFKLFDFKFEKRPHNPKQIIPEFWGGYRIEFKVISKNKLNSFRNDLESLRRNAEIVGNNNSKTFMIDISHYEYIESKVKIDFSGYTIFVYSPEMIVYEKLRAICQQMPEYLIATKGNNRGASARAKDFYDIFLIMNKLRNVDIFKESNLDILKSIFKVKNVDFKYLSQILDTLEFHRSDYELLKSTVLPTEKLEEFDYYFYFVIEEVVKKLISLLDNKPST